TSGELLSQPFEIDTCAWGWASLGKTLLYWLIIISGYLSVAFFIFRSILAPIINVRASLPLTEDK
ncbi:MAG TPA: hypothetical protein VK595_00615, partial [Vicinamibacterales bacterium]|nr:hypothetical protein [Vicinamibacterales bacterium]